MRTVRSLPERDWARAITRNLLEHIPSPVESCGATALFVHGDAVDEEVELRLPITDANVFHVTRGART